MAVQAQYHPSNVMNLPINSISCNPTNLQDGEGGGGHLHDYSFQPQPLPLLHQTHHALYNNNNNKPSTTTNSLKRGREGTSTAGVNNLINNPYSLQSNSSSHLINLSQLHNHHHHQQNAVSTGLTLSFHDKQQQQRIQLHQQKQKQQGCQLSLINDGLASQINQHQEEIHQYLRTQEEQLRRTLAEKRQIHYRQLLTTAEEVMTRKLREKEAEVEKATRKNAELEARAAQLSVEAQVWQAKARAQEAAAASLQAQLQQTIMCHRGENSAGGVSCAVEGQAEDAGSAYIDPESERVVEARPKCRGCGKRVASVVVLPCRHLCICTECDGVHLRACPFCLTPKNSTVEVFLS